MPPVLPKTALEVGYWECFLEEVNAWSVYPWPASAILEQAFCQNWPSVQFTSRSIRYEARLPSPVRSVMGQVNLSTGKERKIRRWASRDEKAKHERELHEAFRKRCERWVQADHVWVLFSPSADLSDISKGENVEDPPLAEPYSLGRRLSFSEFWWPGFLRTTWRADGGPPKGLVRAKHPFGKPCNFAIHRLQAPASTVSETGPEWTGIIEYWNSRVARLVGALRIQSRPLLQGFAAAREAMLARLCEDGDEGAALRKLEVRMMWHGTKSIDSLLHVCNEGFDRGQAHTCAFGKGCYFATKSTYSERYACNVSVPGDKRSLRAMILAAVLIGECVQGSPNMYPPPVKPHSKGGERYENSVDDLHNPQIVVTYKDYQAVPLYVVVFSS